MAKPTWDDTEEIEDIPSFEDTTDIEELEMQAEPSMLESAGRGAVQGATFGLGEEIGAAALSPLELLRSKISSLIPGSSENIDAQLREQGFTGDIQEQGLIDKYKELRDVTREANVAAEEANPATYMAADIAGGIIPAIATGGGAAAAKVGTTLGKEGIKEAAKLGAKYGAVSGLGYGESDLTEGDISGAATDVGVGALVGGVAGAALPVAGKAIKKGASKLGSGAKSLLESIVPESEAIKAGYKYGKEGKKLTQDVVDEDMKKTAASILDRIKSAKNEIDLDGVKQQLDDLGIKVDTKEAFETAIDDIQKIVNNDVMDISNKQILPNLQKMAGVDTEALKMANKAEKKAIQKALEAQSKQEQAIIKGEKKLAEQAAKSGDDLVTIQDIQRQMDDLELPLTTSKGQIGGVKGKFEGPEGEYQKMITSDTTPYQPQISSVLGPDGRPIVQTKDLGSGKISAMVGDLSTKVEKDLGNMTVTEVESIRKQLNVLTKMAKTQGAEGDPVIARAKQLAVQLRDLTDKAVAKEGPAELAAARKKMSDILSAEDLLGTSRTKAVEAGAKKNEQIRTLADKLGFAKGFKTRDEAAEAIEKLGKDIVPEADAQRLDMFKELNAVLGRESQENISRAGMYKKAAGQLPNVAGRAVKKVGEAAGTILSPVMQSKNAITNLSGQQLTTFGNKLTSSENKGLQDIGNRLLEAASSEGAAKQNLLWSLSQSPAMRELIKRQASSLEEDEQVIFGETESELPEISAPVEGINREPSVARPIDEQDVTEEEPSDDNFDDVIAKRESGGDYTAENSLGYLGKYQFGGMALQDLGYKDSKGDWTGKDGINSKEEFLASKEAQENAFKEWKPILKRYLSSNGATDYIGKDFNGIKVTEDGLMAAAHLVGAGAVNKMLKSGEIPEDANGTKATDYMRMFQDESKAPEEKTGGVDLSTLLNTYAEQDLPISEEESVEENVPSEAEINDIEASIDVANKMQGSGDQTPVDDLEELIGKIDRLRISEDVKDDLAADAMDMTSYSQGLALKEKLRGLMG